MNPRQESPKLCRKKSFETDTRNVTIFHAMLFNLHARDVQHSSRTCRSLRFDSHAGLNQYKPF
jgi:hypothetical protein